MCPEMRNLLGSIARPYRYCGGEVGAIHKDWDGADVHICLVFPDTYEIGMSHLGISILYHAINRESGMLAERAFAPWFDMEARLRESRTPLFSLESRMGLAEFDVVGISLGYELTYTNLLAVLELAGIPLRAKARSDGDPLVIAGGPCAFNPMPVAPFLDAVVIGDGEDVALEIAGLVRDAKRDGTPRSDLVRSLARLQGVYVPCLGRGQPPAGMARVASIEDVPLPLKPIVAHAATQERAAVEVARGCTRGCRFCQAGYTYRPLRQRSSEGAARAACEMIASTGREEFSFLALSIGDWPALESALGRVQNDSPIAVNASLPSLRVESLTDAVTAGMGGARSGSFTMAPEAATERMRRFINKGNSDSDLYASVERVFAGGWHQVKLYFMLGLPGETGEDVDGIVRVANRCLDIGRRYHGRPTITVSTSTFIPKAHTPFQWDEQISIEETLRLQQGFKRGLRRPGLAYRWHNAEMSFLEGVLSRGGEELADAIELAYRSGARFDGWDECFDLARWREAFAEVGIEPESYLAERSPDFEFPWEFLGAGPSRDFLWREKQQALELTPTPDCATGACSGCGICDPERGLVNRLADNRNPGPGTRDPEIPSPVPGPRSPVPSSVFRYRVHYTKLGRASFLGHLELVDAFRRALRAAALPLAYSEGFRPRARVDAGDALPVGVLSEVEYMDVELTEEIDSAAIAGSMRGCLPDGVTVAGAVQVPVGSPSVSGSISRMTYEVSSEGLDERAVAAKALLASDKPIPFTRVRKGRETEVDIRNYVDELAIEKGGVLRLTVRARQPAMRLAEILQALIGVSVDEARRLAVRKVSVEWK